MIILINIIRAIDEIREIKTTVEFHYFGYSDSEIGVKQISSTDLAVA